MPRPSCSTGTSHADKQDARASPTGRDAAYNPLYAELDPSRVGHRRPLARRQRRLLRRPDRPAREGDRRLGQPERPRAGPYACPSGSSQAPRRAGGQAGAGHVRRLRPDADAVHEPTPTARRRTPRRRARSRRRALAASSSSAAAPTTSSRSSRTPASAATLRGEDLVAWYTTAWFDRFVKGDSEGDRAAAHRPLARTTRRRPPSTPTSDGNLFSFYYDSPLWVDGRTCADLRAAQGCGLAPDGLGPFSALGAAGLG